MSVGGVRASVEGTDEARPVDRLHDVGVGRDVSGLVGLQLSDEVQHEVRGACVPQRGSHLGKLLPGLLVAVLTEVAHAELVEQEHVRRREELRHGDHGDLARVASCVGTGPPDPGSNGAQRSGELVATAYVVTHRSAAWGRLTTPANRPVTPSRR